MDLLASIRGGAQLKKVDENTAARRESSGDDRGGLLAAIRGGAQLRKVEDSPRPAAPATGLDGLAGALSAALNARSAAVHGDSDEEDDDDDWDDDDDDDFD